jgi:hypothetical protein
MLITYDNQNNNEIEITNQILNIYNNYYTKHNKLKKNMKNDFIIHQVDIVKQILELSINENHLRIAYIFAKQLV